MGFWDIKRAEFGILQNPYLTIIKQLKNPLN